MRHVRNIIAYHLGFAIEWAAASGYSLEENARPAIYNRFLGVLKRLCLAYEQASRFLLLDRVDDLLGFFPIVGLGEAA